MSNRAIDAVKDFSRSKGSERLLLFMIADGINKDSATYHAKVSTLMAECNMTERWVQKLIPRLIALGELVVINNPGFTSDYAIPIFEDEMGYDPQPCTNEYHDCTGFHTPLSVNRDSYRREEVQQARHARKQSQRKIAAPTGVNDSTPPPNESADTRGGVNDSTPPGEREYTPPVNDSTPPGEREYTPSTLSLTHSFTQVSTDALARETNPPITEKATERTPDEGAAPLPPPPLAPEADDAERDLQRPLSLLWSQTAMRLRQSDLSDAEWSNWIVPLHIGRAWWDDDDNLRVRLIAPGSYHAGMIDQRFVYIISDAIAKVMKLRTRQVCVSVHAAAHAVQHGQQVKEAM